MGAYLDLWDVSDGHPKAREELERLTKIEEMAVKLAEMLDGYQDSCGEDHPRPNFDCPTCGKEERVLADYRALVDA